jgi:hypothetical protein
METLKIRNMLKAALLIGVVSTTLIECKKEKKEDISPTASTTTTTPTYTSLSDFFNKNGVQLETHTVNATTGGTFTSAKGTIVSIPANAFVFSGGGAVAGNVTIEFKDIFSKSDMLLSNMPTQTIAGPLKSAGEFFIKAVLDGNPLLIAPGKKIDIEQPANGLPIDSAMAPFVFNKDSAVWKRVNGAPTFSNTANAPSSEITFNPNSYVFSLYQYNSPVSEGSWCNSDNSTYFSAYTQSTLTMHPSFDIASYNSESVDIFLVFHDINSMVHVYKDWNGSDFPYTGAPVGLKCTVVAIGEKDGKIYSSFNPITISANQTVNFNLTETTTDAFKTALTALN